MKLTTLKAIVTQTVSSIDLSERTRLTEIVFENDRVYMRTNFAGATPDRSGPAIDPVQTWLNQHDPDAC